MNGESVFPAELRAVNVKIHSDGYCRSKEIWRDLYTARMFCASSNLGRVDACSGDSGGSLVCKGASGGGKYYYLRVLTLGTCQKP